MMFGEAMLFEKQVSQVPLSSPALAVGLVNAVLLCGLTSILLLIKTAFGSFHELILAFAAIWCVIVQWKVCDATRLRDTQKYPSFFQNMLWACLGFYVIMSQIIASFNYL